MRYRKTYAPTANSQLSWLKQRRKEKGIIPGISGNAGDGLQLKTLFGDIEVEVPEFQLGLVREVSVHGTRPGTGHEQRARSAWRPGKGRGPRNLSQPDHGGGLCGIGKELGYKLS